MKIIQSIVAVFVILFSSNFVAAGEGCRILFIGNSFTNYGPIPELVQEIAENFGQEKPYVQNAAVNGKSFAFHRQHEPTLKAIDKGGWDFVVLQEYSTNPTDNAGNPAEFKANAAWLYDRIKKASPEAKVVLYETWARHEMHDIYKDKFGSRLEMQEQLIKHYHDCAENYIPGHCESEMKNDILLAPVGEVWQKNYMQKNIMLHGDDLYHAGNVGQFVNALVIYATIYDAEVTGVKPVNGVSDGEAEYLAEVADMVVSKK